MQSNQNIIVFKNENIINIIDNSIWENILHKIKNKESLIILNKYIHETSIKYNIDKKNLIKDFLNYIIRNKRSIVNNEFLNFVENLIHSQECNNKIYVNYAITKLQILINVN
jgi:hypothetical protein